ncbi:flagellar basal body rod protein FlgB [Shewanella sp. OPT22]|uniref:flagellar basal body rod protein FlgB n=1 Tax=Parashewanella hymeniacidonis TaxID=2807618 RepID=UPI0010212A86|nr:flagellar basal body rod protein FlgB [Parashewanella hymeniacidonis]MBM7073058.1 flagellar basal body rod protein FlgB [Parashewanella hymeniacidonis]RYV02508.1 flagellar basal body rod protein FlgB [Shewanella sp. OPT22]
MAIGFDKALGVHQHTLGVRAKRAEVLSSNIANADTPHYKAKDVDFEQAMRSAVSKQRGVSLGGTHQQHFSIQSVVQAETGYRIPNQPDTGDGNTVDMQTEQASFMENALEYQMSLGFLESKFNGMKKAIRGE